MEHELKEDSSARKPLSMDRFTPHSYVGRTTTWFISYGRTQLAIRSPKSFDSAVWMRMQDDAKGWFPMLQLTTTELFDVTSGKWHDVKGNAMQDITKQPACLLFQTPKGRVWDQLEHHDQKFDEQIDAVYAIARCLDLYLYVMHSHGAVHDPLIASDGNGGQQPFLFYSPLDRVATVVTIDGFTTTSDKIAFATHTRKTLLWFVRLIEYFAKQTLDEKFTYPREVLQEYEDSIHVGHLIQAMEILDAKEDLEQWMKRFDKVPPALERVAHDTCGVELQVVIKPSAGAGAESAATRHPAAFK